MSNFGRQSLKEYSCEIISKSVHQFSRRSRLKLISIYCPNGHLVEGHPRNLPVKLFQNPLSHFGGEFV